MPEADKKDPNTRLRSVLENAQQQIQLVIANGAKIWPDLYHMPQARILKNKLNNYYFSLGVSSSKTLSKAL